MKKLIRKFAVWLRAYTDQWVVPEEVWRNIDNDNYKLAEEQLDEIRKVWPSDPEEVRARAIINFMAADEELEADAKVPMVDYPEQADELIVGTEEPLEVNDIIEVTGGVYVNYFHDITPGQYVIRNYFHNITPGQYVIRKVLGDDHYEAENVDDGKTVNVCLRHIEYLHIGELESDWKPRGKS